MNTIKKSISKARLAKIKGSVVKTDPQLHIDTRISMDEAFIASPEKTKLLQNMLNR